MKLLQYFILLFSLSIYGSLFSQTRVGQVLDAEAPSDLFGFSVTTDNSGERIAVGAFRNNTGGARNGRVYVYNNINGKWIESGTTIFGDVGLQSDELGKAVALSGDGKFLAAGASGYVKILRENASGEWEQIGQNIVSGQAGDGFGTSLDISEDGSRIIIGAPLDDTGGAEAGRATVYELSGTTWVQVGNPFDGVADVDRLGTELKISADGSRIAIGSPFDDTGGSGAGLVRVYDEVGGVWTQVGPDFVGTTTNENVGSAIDLSADGQRLLIGTRNFGTFGRVTVFQENQGSWSTVGSPILGSSANGRLGLTVSLSGDGDRFAARNTRGGNGGAPSLEVYHFDGATWNKIGDNLSTQVGDIFAASHQLSEDGLRIVVGAHQASVNGSVAGQAHNYYLYPASCNGSCPTCSDGVTNGQETGVDCGGPDCGTCSTCTDGVQNGGETGIDCGGPDCPSCNLCGSDYDALIALYDATDGPNWRNNTGWVEGKAGTSCDPCNFNGVPWYGIACDGNGRVTCVDMDSKFNCINVRVGGSSNGLNGPLPAAFFDLPFLRHLSLENNNLPGPIPDEIGNLTNLRYLNIRNCDLTGTIPTTLGELTNLEELRIGFDDLTGGLPAELGELVNLTTLNIDLLNNFGGGIPAEFANLTELRVLNLTGNYLRGSFPTWLNQLTKLESLSLEGNFMQGPMPDNVYTLTNLELLNVGYNNVGPAISPQIANLTKLRNFSCRAGGLSNPLPNVFDQLPDLSRFNIEQNNVSGQIPATLAENPAMFSLVLRNNSFEGPIPAGINPTGTLRFFAANNNRLEGCIPATLSAQCPTGYNLSANPGLAYQGDYSAWCTNGNISLGAPCDDGDANTSSSAIDADCNCVGSNNGCGDGIQNNAETGVDCGGPICPVCPTCADNIQNGDETGVDCGGADCPACPSCNDGLINNGETDVDCGGPNCLPCTVNCAEVDIVVDPRGRVASVELSPEAYADWVQNDNFCTSSDRKELIGQLYCTFEDEFDFIFLVLNEASRPSSIQYVGKYFPVKNDTRGIGTNLFDNSGEYGSDGKLQGVMQLTSRGGLQFGPSLHELMHRWANFGLATQSVQDPGPSITSFPFKPHWGFTGGSSKGQLGGFLQSSLEELGNDQYRVGSFGPFANGGNSQPYNELERYLAGFITAAEVTDFDVFTDITALDVSAGTTFTFTAETRTEVTANNITSLFGGARLPAPTTSQKDFRALTVVVTEAPLTQDEWDQVDATSAWIEFDGADNNPLYNFWEATQGAATLQTNDLLAALPVDYLSFQALAREKHVALAWSTAGEENNHGFYPEHSLDGINWSTLGFVAATGSHQLATNYDFRHNTPAAGSNFYRLRQLDTDGATSYSEVRAVEYQLRRDALRVAPNPVSNGVLHLDIIESFRSGRLSLYSIDGKLLRNQSADRTNLRVDDLPAGTYVLRLAAAGELVVRRFVVR